MLPNIFLTVLMGVFVWCVGLAQFPLLIKLIAQAFCGATIYIIFLKKYFM